MTITLDDILTSHRTGRAVVMGILNVTPDSFSDGGNWLDPSAAIDHARQMLADGADIIDIGPESTRPGSQRVSPEEQIRRIEHVIEPVAATGAIVSIDTTSSAVARFALDRGAHIINDVSAGREDPAILTLAAQRNAPIILMHMLGQPKTMQTEPHYDDVVAEVRDFCAQRIAAAIQAGVPQNRIILDPGIGFGKRLEHNLALLAGVESLLSLDCPVLIGASRKQFIGQLTGKDIPAERLAGTLAAHLAARSHGASIFRVHDVSATVDAIKVFDRIQSARRPHA